MSGIAERRKLGIDFDIVATLPGLRVDMPRNLSAINSDDNTYLSLFSSPITNIFQLIESISKYAVLQIKIIFTGYLRDLERKGMILQTERLVCQKTAISVDEEKPTMYANSS